MPYRNIYFKKENCLLNIFYGVLSSHDLRSHTLEMYKQRTLTDSFSKITDATLVTGFDNITTSNIMGTISVKLSDDAVKSNGSVIVTNRPEVNAVAELVRDHGNRIGDSIRITSTLHDALAFYGLLSLKERAASQIDKLREYFPAVKM